ncbi:hypothetical protein BofuT4_P072150.1 [Botrytis cinerea T4]|uniref:Uncharacterized protein n=1 Tax=Botryotinia fuckeliana (strain T4) TaxID=999810 RepID=G2XQ31_BOTF4|nr:hypothetical protein BofuT4_P072150.1 [Botrytis cinerea T4]
MQCHIDDLSMGSRSISKGRAQHHHITHMFQPTSHFVIKRLLID